MCDLEPDLNRSVRRRKTKKGGREREKVENREDSRFFFLHLPESIYLGLLRSDCGMMEETTPPVGWCDWICNNAQSRAATCYLRFRRYTAFLQISNFKGGFLFYSSSKFGYTRETTRPRITQKGTSSLVPIPLPCFRLPLSISANLSSTYIRTPFPRFQQLHLLQPNFCFHFS